MRKIVISIILVLCLAFVLQDAVLIKTMET